MSLRVPSGPYGPPSKQKKREQKEQGGMISYKMLDSTNISHREIQLLREQIWRMRHPNSPEREQLWPDDLQPKVTELKDIATSRIFQWESDTTWFRAYEVELHQFTGFQYVLDFGGTTNHEIQGTFGVTGMRVEANLQPFELETICLVSRNKLDPFKFSVKMSWVTTDVHPAILQTALAMNEHRIKSEYELMTNVGVQQDDDIQTLRQKLCSVQPAIEFVDPDFYPSVGALYKDANKSSKINDEQVMWRRSSDFCKNPAYFVDNDGDDEDGIDPSDVKQGQLGNCWFCCCLASMAERAELIEQLFVSSDGGAEGIHVVRYWHNGVPKNITLDDYFPCKPFSGCIYTKTGDDELWVAILEKAYAKLYGCYERLISGSPYHALPDLTGNPAKIYELGDRQHLKGLWEQLLDWNRTENNLMSAACDETSRLNPTDAGLMHDHSYSIIDAKEEMAHGNMTRLLEIRNPWGHGEWKGDWSDFSPLWTTATMAVFGVTDLDPEDGAFWMCWEDFLQYFTTLTVCFCRRDWARASILSNLEWNADEEMLMVHPIRMKVPRGGHVQWMGMFQTDCREVGAQSYIDLAAFVFLERGNERQPVGFIGNEAARQVFQEFGVNGEVFKESLGEGTYLIVPWTSGRHWDPESGPLREIGFSAHAHGVGSGVMSMRQLDEVYGREEMDQILLDVGMGLGELKMWHDLERRHLRVGQMDVYVGRNNSDSKILVFSMSGDLDNIVNACGYPNLSEGCAFEMNPEQCAIFGIQVMENPKEAGSSAYKFGLKSKPATH